ncbi:MAG TPA: M56 family metallopeptidase, partial [Phycisphaerae bacterium]|nr:M56 family metallopeptidase [Phycisphaerae bacterium]
MGGMMHSGVLAAGDVDALFDSRFAETLGWTLVHSLWEIAAVGAVAGIALSLLRRASANLRYLVGCAAFLLMVAVPVGTYMYLLPPAPPRPVVMPAVVTPPAAELPAQIAEVTVGAALPDLRPIDRTPVQVPWTIKARRALRPWLPWAEGAYLLGMAVLMARLGAGYGRVRTLAHNAKPIGGKALERLENLARRMGVRRAVRLLESAAVEVPTLLGALKPVILLPAAALAGLSAEQLDALLAHELAHIRRHDYIANLGQSLLETLLFYHPAAWWLSARIRQEREHCCDDAAIAATTDRLAYARALAAMETLRAPATIALAARGGRLLPRIRRILGDAPMPQHRRTRRRLLPTSIVAALIIFLTAVIYIGCNRSTSSPTPAAPQAATQPPAANPETHPATILVEAKILRVSKATYEAATGTPAPNPQSTTGNPGDVAPAANGYFKVFDAGDADALAKLVAAFQADKETVTVSSPKILAQSGELAKIEVTQQQNYVKDFKKSEPQNPGEEPKVTLNVQTLTTGFEMELTATLDGNKITTTLHPKLTTLLGMDTISDAADPKSGGPFYQIPHVATSELNSTFSLADGGTAVLSTLGPVGEKEITTSVPGLSNLPGVGGLFTNRKYERVDSMLVVIVKATVKTGAATEEVREFDAKEFSSKPLPADPVERAFDIRDMI